MTCCRNTNVALSFSSSIRVFHAEIPTTLRYWHQCPERNLLRLLLAGPGLLRLTCNPWSIQITPSLRGPLRTLVGRHGVQFGRKIPDELAVVSCKSEATGPMDLAISNHPVMKTLYSGFFWNYAHRGDSPSHVVGLRLHEVKLHPFRWSRRLGCNRKLLSSLSI